ncbi:hypothetical protein NPIL_157471, partial [Nephila pilipes]
MKKIVMILRQSDILKESENLSWI